MDIILSLIVVLIVVIGIIGTVLPLLPGTSSILFAALLLKIFLASAMSWSAFGFVFGLWAFSILVEFLGIIIGTRWGGGSKWAAGGASLGALAGIFWSLPGILLGSFLGAALAEQVATEKNPWQTLRAGLGAGVGYLMATIVRVLIALIMTGVVISGLWRHFAS